MSSSFFNSSKCSQFLALVSTDSSIFNGLSDFGFFFGADTLGKGTELP